MYTVKALLSPGGLFTFRPQEGVIREGGLLTKSDFQKGAFVMPDLSKFSENFCDAGPVKI